MTSAIEVRNMFSSIAKRYDLTNSALSMGIHHLWRRKLVSMLPDMRGKDSVALDLCTGTCDLIKPLSSKYDRVVGADFCLPMLQNGKQKSLGFSVVQGDGLKLPFQDQSFDLVTVAFGVRNFEILEKGLSQIRRVLKDDGILVVLEFGQPSNRLWAAIYDFYSKHMMPLIGSILTGNRQAYTYLPQTARAFPCGAKFCQILESLGYNNAISRPLSGGIAYIYTANSAH